MFLSQPFRKGNVNLTVLPLYLHLTLRNVDIEVTGTTVHIPLPPSYILVSTDTCAHQDSPLENVGEELGPFLFLNLPGLLPLDPLLFFLLLPGAVLFLVLCQCLGAFQQCPLSTSGQGPVLTDVAADDISYIQAIGDQKCTTASDSEESDTRFVSVRECHLCVHNSISLCIYLPKAEQKFTNIMFFFELLNIIIEIIYLIHMLSLSPRYDLFRFAFPKDFIPKEVNDKYQKVLSKNAGVLTTPIDYLNESIQGINIPGISDLTIDQEQHSHNNISGERLNVEPIRQNTYKTPANPLANISKEVTVTFRFNQGFYNYFLLYETIFWKYCKPLDYPNEDYLYIDLMDETGRVTARIKYYDCHINGIDGIDLNYSKIERDTGTFDVVFKFNNIDFVFVDEEGNEI